MFLNALRLGLVSWVLAGTAGFASGAEAQKDGAEAAGSESPAAFRAAFEKEVVTWEKLIKLPGFAASLK